MISKRIGVFGRFKVDLAFSNKNASVWMGFSIYDSLIVRLLFVPGVEMHVYNLTELILESYSFI